MASAVLVTISYKNNHIACVHYVETTMMQLLNCGPAITLNNFAVYCLDTCIHIQATPML